MNISRSYIRSIDSDRYKNFNKKRVENIYGEENKKLFDFIEEDSSKNMTFYINTPHKLKIEKYKDDYADLLMRNLKKYESCRYLLNSEFSSVYFAGDNYLVDLDKIEDLMNYINSKFILTRPEITIELDCDKIDDLYLNRIKDIGFNKIILNVRTFDNSMRKILGENGDSDLLLENINKCLDFGFRNLYIKISYNYPSFDNNVLLEDMQKLNSLDIAGFIMVDEKDYSRNDKKVRESFSIMSNMGRDVCYDFSRCNQMSRSNRDKRKYQKNLMNQNDIIPIGLSAIGQVSNHIILNPSSVNKLNDMIDNTCIFKQTKVSKNINKCNAMLEEMFLDMNQFEDIKEDKIHKLVDELLMEDFFEEDNQLLHLTDKGIYWIENIKSELVETLI